MTAAVDDQVLEWHRDQRMRSWIQEKLSLTKGQIGAIARRLGLRWRHTTGPATAGCVNGHNVAHVGIVDGARCGRCGGDVPIPADRVVLPSGRFAMRFCRRGHDTLKVGRLDIGTSKVGICAVCVAEARDRRAADRRAARRGARVAPRAGSASSEGRALKLLEERDRAPKWRQIEIDEEIRGLVG